MILNKEDLEDYIVNKEHLKTVGKFDESGCFEFKNEEVKNKELEKFTFEDIKNLYLQKYNPVLHYKTDLNAPDFKSIAFESLINWWYS